MAQVPNKNIDNASGQVVRLDIQNTIKAVTTHNFGPRNDAGTILPCEFLADDTTNKLLIRKSSGGDQANPNPTSGTAADFFTVGNLDEENLGLLPKAGGTMTGQLLGDDGLGSGSPAYSFDNNTDTGMFRSGSNTIGFSTAGITRVSISNAGLDMTNALPIRFQDSSGAPFVALKSPTSLGDDRTFTLPKTTGSAGQFLSVSTSNHSANNAELEFSTVNGVPIGSVFCIAHTSIPSGYVECNGANIPNGTGTVNGVTANFAPLRALIGSKLPDLRGEFIRGFDNGRGVDSQRGMLTSQGHQHPRHNHNVSASSTAGAHSHALNYQRKHVEDTGTAAVTDIRREGGDSDGGSQNFTNNTNSGFMNNASITVTTSISQSNRGGADNSSETRPRNIAMMYIIKF